MSTSEDPRATWLRRVQALIAQAESTQYPDEAETFLAKAQELMARHAIDESMLQPEHDRAAIVSDNVAVEAPYASARASLLGQVARANGCRLVVCSSGRGTQHCVLVGRRPDVESTRLLFAALSLHATRLMLSAPVPSGDTPRRFRHAFLLAFAHRIGQRLRAAATDAERAAEQASGRSAALVLARRDEDVDRALREQFPRLASRRTTASSYAGAREGSAAADRAQLRGAGLPGARRSLHAG